MQKVRGRLETNRERGGIQQQLLTRKLLSHDDLATAAQCDEVEGGLTEINPDRLNL
jgi:hypothetical protein